MSLKVTVAGKTDRGLVRSINEDNFKVDHDSNLFVVCDGMGGHQAGEVASREACDVISYCFSNPADEILRDSTLALPARLPSRGDLLVKAIRLANRSIYTKAHSHSKFSGMGTTVVAAALEDGLINIAHAGDSRAYQLTEDNLVPLTIDHSWVAELEQTGKYSAAEAAQVVGKNVITRALGVHETVEIDFRADRMQAKDIYIFCTDGLCAYANDDEIYAVAKDCNGEVQSIVDTLVQFANERGGQDNVTVVAMRVDEVEGGSELVTINPVTVSAEEAETVLKENQILESFARLRPKTEEIITEVVRKRPKSGIYTLFFAVLALLIIVLILYFLFSR